MSLFSFLKGNKESYSLVFNLGSGSVSGSLVKFTEKAGVEITHYDKEIIPFQEQISVPRHAELMKSSLTALAGRLQAEGLKKINLRQDGKVRISRVFYMFSSPWCASQVKTVRIKESKPFKVTKAYVDKIVAEQEKRFCAETAQAGQVIERQIVKAKLNGYSVSDFYDKSAKELEISIFFTVVPADILESIENAVAKTFYLKDVHCHSSVLAVTSVIRNLYPHLEDFIHLDVSEEITDISVIKDDVLSQSISLPFGRNDFLRELGKALGMTEAVADSMIRLQSAKQNDELAALKISVAMDKAAADWLAKIFQSLDELKQKIYVPEHVFLVMTSDLAPFLRTKLEKADFKASVIDNRQIHPPLPGDDVMLKLELRFLDNLYKI